MHVFARGGAAMFGEPADGGVNVMTRKREGEKEAVEKVEGERKRKMNCRGHKNVSYIEISLFLCSHLLRKTKVKANGTA